LHAVARHLRRRRDGISVKGCATDGLDLRPVSEQQDIDATERAFGAIRPFLVDGSLPNDFSDDQFQLSEKLCRNHADFINEDESQALTPGREFAVVSRGAGSLVPSVSPTGIPDQ